MTRAAGALRSTQPVGPGVLRQAGTIRAHSKFKSGTRSPFFTAPEHGGGICLETAVTQRRQHMRLSRKQAPPSKAAHQPGLLSYRTSQTGGGGERVRSPQAARQALRPCTCAHSDWSSLSLNVGKLRLKEVNGHIQDHTATMRISNEKELSRNINDDPQGQSLLDTVQVQILSNIFQYFVFNTCSRANKRKLRQRGWEHFPKVFPKHKVTKVRLRPKDLAFCLWALRPHTWPSELPWSHHPRSYCPWSPPSMISLPLHDWDKGLPAQTLLGGQCNVKFFLSCFTVVHAFDLSQHVDSYTTSVWNWGLEM